MIGSIASQEAMEHFVEKMIAACAAHQQNPRPRCVRMSPSDHYLIAKYAWATDLTVWLSEQQDEPSVKVHFFRFIGLCSNYLILRVSFHTSRTICSLGFKVWHTMEMITTSLMPIVHQSSSLITNSISTAFYTSTTWHMIYNGNKTPSIPTLAPTLWYSLMKKRRISMLSTIRMTPDITHTLFG